jgi:phenylacetate-CoA ligase
LMSAFPETRSVEISGRGTPARRRYRARDLISVYLNYPILFPMRKRLNRRGLEIMRNKLKVMRRTRAEIEEVQRLRLRELLSFCSLRNPFYRERFRQVGLNEKADFCPEGLAQLPPLTKVELQESFARLVSEGVSRERALVNSSGGSTGDPVNFLQDRNFVAESLATAFISDRMQGWDFGVRRALLWGSPKECGGVSSAKSRLSAYLNNENWHDSFNMGLGEMQRFHEQLMIFQPDNILAYASSIHLFARFLKEARLRPKYPLRSIISSAETLTDAMRAEVEECFSVPVYDRYGSREVGTIASECDQHVGLHLHMLDHYVEVVDFETGQRVWDKPGRVLITLLTNYAMPLIRYDIGDVGVLTKDFCPCGRSTRLVKKLLGRSSDFVVSPLGRLIHGEYFTHAFYGHRGIRQFQFVQETATCYLVRIIKSGEFQPSSLEAIEHDMELVLGRSAKIRFEFVENIPPAPSGKWRFTISYVPLPVGQSPKFSVPADIETLKSAGTEAAECNHGS